MTKIVNGKRVIQGGRIITTLVIIAIITNASVLAWIDPVKLNAYREFISSPGFELIIGILMSAIGLVSIVRSIFPKPVKKIEVKQ